MKIQSLNIQNFKSFKNTTIHFNSDLNILTGVNNSGKTSILEALALWNECFEKLINQAKRAVKGKYNAGDYVLGPKTNRYFEFDEINSVRCPNFEDLFRDRDSRNKIVLGVTLASEVGQIKIAFKIAGAVGKYNIELEDEGFEYEKFNKLFKRLPDAIDTYYASPVSFIEQNEKFETDPNIKAIIKERKSSKVIRNRIYRLYQTTRFQQFQRDLSYILFNNASSKISIVNRSDIQQDQSVIINYKIGEQEVEKDIALLGSGTLQSLEILLNLYQQTEQKKDLKIILLDEPDSHIHRDIQARILDILSRFSTDNQIFITTHNEALIRSASLNRLFHIDGNAEGEIHNMYQKELPKLGIPHFKGLYPSSLHPLIKSIGNDSGLDFINAIEAERIVFVEGDDDARAIHRLLQEYPQNHDRKIMYWVLGGVSQVFSKIDAFKTFFSEIKNNKTLWEKCYLVWDKDILTDNHINLVSEKINNKLKLPNHFSSSYTFESVLFTDLTKLTELLSIYLISEKNIESSQLIRLFSEIEEAYESISEDLSVRYSREKIDSSYTKQYIGSYVDKTKTMFNSACPLLENDPVKLLRELEDYYEGVVKKKEYYKLMTKQDVQNVLNKALAHVSIELNIENEFCAIINHVNKSTWFSEWDGLKNI